MIYPDGGMTADEFESELFRKFGHRIPKKPAADFDDPLDALDPATVRELLPDLLDTRAKRRLHPLIPEIRRQEKSFNQIRELAGMTVGDFLSAMAGSLSSLVVSQFSDATADIRKIARNVDVRDYRANALPTLSMPEPPEVVDDGGLQQLRFKVVEAQRSGKLRQFGGKVRFSKSVWWSLGEELATGIVDYASSVFGAIETRLIAETLEGGTVTTVASSGLGETGLNSAAEAMREQLNSAGQRSNLAIGSIIVPSKLEMTARKLRQDLGWSDLNIVVNAWLSSDTSWFALCNPAISAPLLRLQMRGAGIPRVCDNARESGPETGMSFAVEHAVDFVLATAPGLIKATA